MPRSAPRKTAAQKAAEDTSPIEVRVQAHANVLGLVPQQVATVAYTDVVKAHIKAGYLTRLTKAEAAEEHAEQVEQALASGGQKPPDPDAAGGDVTT